MDEKTRRRESCNRQKREDPLMVGEDLNEMSLHGHEKVDRLSCGGNWTRAAFWLRPKRKWKEKDSRNGTWSPYHVAALIHDFAHQHTQEQEPPSACLLFSQSHYRRDAEDTNYIFQHKEMQWGGNSLSCSPKQEINTITCSLSDTTASVFLCLALLRSAVHDRFWVVNYFLSRTDITAWLVWDDTISQSCWADTPSASRSH